MYAKEQGEAREWFDCLVYQCKDRVERESARSKHVDLKANHGDIKKKTTKRKEKPTVLFILF
jgi:hypothetical protein